MSRKKYENAEEAQALLDDNRRRPPVLEEHDGLPFQLLNGDQFEVFCFLLVCREKNTNDALLYGGPGDKGRDIVRILEDGSQRFIQCKCAESNLGVTEARQELAKLCVKFYEDEIPQEPDEVRFYASKEFTSEALDLLEDRNEWEEKAEDALNKYLGEEPSEELVEFALDWWPAPHPVNGHELTDRARKYPRVVDEFFSRQKVVDGSKEDVASSVVERLRSSDLSVQQPEPESFQNFLQRAEANNPGLNVTAETTTGETKFEIEAKPDAEGKEFGELTFPDTEAGRRGAEKFQKMRQEGREIVLEGDEFIWHGNFNEPLPDGNPGENSAFRLKPTLEQDTFDVRLDALEDGDVVERIPSSKLVVERLGTEEMEVTIGGRQFAACYTIVVPNPVDGSGDWQLDFQFTEYQPDIALETVRFLQAVADGAELEIYVFDLGNPLLGGVEINSELDSGYYAQTATLLECYAALNEELGLSLKLPEEPEEGEDRLMEILGRGVRGLPTAEPVDAECAIQVPKSVALQALEDWKEIGPSELTLKRKSEHEIQGQRIDLGEENLVLVDAFPATGLEALGEKLESLKDDEFVEIELEFEKIVHVFPEFS